MIKKYRIKYSVFFAMIFFSLTVFGQTEKEKGDTLSAPPELYIDYELPLLDDYGYFSDKNAIKILPSISLLREKTTFEGLMVQFEKGGITSKISYNLSAKYQKGYILYAAYFPDSISPNGDTAKLSTGEVLKKQKPVDDLNNFRAGKPRSIQIEFNPRLYFLENIGMYLGVSGGVTYNLENHKVTPLFSGTSGFTFVIAQHLIVDSYVGIMYDNSLYGSMFEYPIRLRLGLSVGYMWRTKKSEFNFYE